MSLAGRISWWSAEQDATLSHADPQSDAPALRKTCIELEDLADELMMTSNASEMDVVCGKLRLAALDVRRLLMHLTLRSFRSLRCPVSFRSRAGSH